MRLSGPLRLSGYSLGGCWRLAWLRDAARPRAEGQAAAARAAAVRPRAVPREPGRPPVSQAEAQGRPGPAAPEARARVVVRAPAAPAAPGSSHASAVRDRNRAPPAPGRTRAPGRTSVPAARDKTSALTAAPRLAMAHGVVRARQPTDHAGLPGPRCQTGWRGVQPPKGPAGLPADRPPKGSAGLRVGHPLTVPAGLRVGRQVRDPAVHRAARLPTGHPRTAGSSGGLPARAVGPGTKTGSVRPMGGAATGLPHVQGAPDPGPPASERIAHRRAVPGFEPPGRIAHRRAVPGFEPQAMTRRRRTGRGTGGRVSRTRSAPRNLTPRPGLSCPACRMTWPTRSPVIWSPRDWRKMRNKATSTPWPQSASPPASEWSGRHPGSPHTGPGGGRRRCQSSAPRDG